MPDTFDDDYYRDRDREESRLDGRRHQWRTAVVADSDVPIATLDRLREAGFDVRAFGNTLQVNGNGDDAYLREPQ